MSEQWIKPINPEAWHEEVRLSDKRSVSKDLLPKELQ